jgi:putative hydrolase of the HAD superfamily
MTKANIKVLTFDLDDTLWPVAPVIQHAEQQLYQWLSQHAPLLTERFSLQQQTEQRWDYYRQHPELTHQISQIRIAALRHILQQVGYPLAQASHLAEQAFEVFIEARHQVALFDTVVPILEELQQCFRLGVLTNGNADVYRLPIGRFFDFAFSAEQLNASKPAADHFLAAQQFCQCQAADIIHIGDHLEHDILAAQQAGCHSIWYNPTKQQPEQPLPVGRQVQCWTELPAVIAQIHSPT